MHKLHLLLLLFILFSGKSETFASPLDDDEDLIFYPTYLYLDGEKKEYHLKIHAHVFEKKEDSIKRKVLLKSLHAGMEEEEESKFPSEIFQERAKWFLIDNKRGKEIHIELLGNKFLLEKTEANGRSITDIRIDPSTLSPKEKLGGYIEFRNYPSAKNKKSYAGRIYLIPENATCLVSDIDDTLKISDVRNKKALLQNTFRKPFQLVPGMREYYQQLASQTNSCFVNVSASPWQMYTVLNDFFTQNGFPPTIYLMKDFRFKDSDFFNLFEKPEQYKFQSIEPLVKEWKKVKFILVGDSGEKDPEAYAALAKKYPDQISKILIRIAYDENLTSRISSVFDSVPKSKYQFFHSISEMNKTDPP